MHTEYLLVGQGISGTLLSRSLVQAGCDILLLDTGAASASRVASGVINPVTGKRLVRTWMIDTLRPYAWDTYRQIEQELNIAIVKECSILDMHFNPDSRDSFNDKAAAEQEYLSINKEEEQWAAHFRFNYGIGEVRRSLLVDMNMLLEAWQRYLQLHSAIRQEYFDVQELVITENGITYKDITARKVIFCDGAVGADNPWFHMLPWSKDKGEALIASIPGLPHDHIYKQGLSIVPWRDGLFWIGAAHDWKYADMQPTPAYRKQVEEHLNYWLRLPYTITEHLVAPRPANFERKPFVGLHPLHPAVGIFNGMGSKGCSVAPYFAAQFAQHLVNGTALQPDVDVKRFSRVLSRG